MKGAYWDSEVKRAQEQGLAGYPVFTRKAATDTSYLACARKLLAARDRIYPQFATHNAQTMAAIMHMAGEGYRRGDYEFQCLHGMGEPLYDQVVANPEIARLVRIYAPVGSHETLLAYLVRRLLENGANTSFVNRIVDEKVAVDELVADPVEEAARLAGLAHPRIPLPAELYGTARGNSRGFDLSSEAVRARIAAHNDPRTWTFALTDLNHYNWCFWLVGLALALEIPDDQWQRLLALIGGEGEDVLLDRVIASRAPARRIGNRLLHAKPYARLLESIEAGPAAQPAALRDFVTHWYAELARKGKDELWWYLFGDPVKHPLEKGSYFGRWCVEAVAAVKAFGLDDSLCLGHEHYPGDLLRPEPQA